ncbi:zinc finger C2HC domain-containing protein 1C [Ctenodactylus gundi]
MAGLQLAPHLPVGVMFPHNKTEALGLHSAKQDPHEQGDSSQRSLMEHLRNGFQQKLMSNRELALDNVYTHPTRQTHTKARSYSYPHCAGISQRDSRSDAQGQAKDLLYSSSPQFQCSKPIPVTKKRIGVDRAYPLKPMVHRKSRSTDEAGTDGEPSVYPVPPEPREFPDSNFVLRNWVNSSVLAAMRGEKAMANLHRTDWMEIRRLEAAGENLKEEIQRKEILLREKLKKTEEELRRIQKEKEQAKENESGQLQRRTLPRRRVKGSNTNTTYTPGCSPESGSEEAFSTDRREDKTWGRPQENSSPFQYSDHEIQRLKRERLVASNNKIRDQALAPPVEFFWPLEEPSSTMQGFTSSRPSRAPGSSGSSCPAEEPELGKCSYCGRTFLLLRLERHSAVCSRMKGSKRKVFDSSRARAKGTELEQYLNWKGPTSDKVEPPRKSNWRQRHESFIRTLRQAREVQQVIAKGGNPSDLPPIQPAENPDYVQCPHCSRRFAPKVAERHIPKCKTIKNRPPPPRKHDN